jgi:hypothetical protein
MQVGSGGGPPGGRAGQEGLIRFVLPAPAVDIHGNEAQRACGKPVKRGMGILPMNHRQDADATKPHRQAISLGSVVLKPAN